MKILGYVELYVRIDIDGYDPCYVKIDVDFIKPLTRIRLWGILRSNKKLMRKMGFKVKNISYVSKEEYVNSNTELTYSYSIDEENNARWTENM